MDGNWLDALTTATELGEVLIAPVVWWLWRLGHRVGECERDLALLGQRIDLHDREARAERERIGESVGQLSQELGLMRAESTEQHRALRTEMVELSKDGTASREKLHDRINELTRLVDRMLGEQGKA